MVKVFEDCNSVESMNKEISSFIRAYSETHEVVSVHCSMSMEGSKDSYMAIVGLRKIRN